VVSLICKYDLVYVLKQKKLNHAIPPGVDNTGRATMDDQTL